MPNEAVKCPNCGSGDVKQLAADSYACEHCHTNFHWVNPTKSTIVHESRVCNCGNNAVAHCVRCHEPLCEKHKNTWNTGLTLMGVVDNNLPKKLLEIARGVLAEHRIPEDLDIRVFVCLCAKCESECYVGVTALRRVIHDEKEALGRACTICYSKSLRGQCSICKVWVCSQHGAECKKCHQIVCMQHIGGGGWCQTCSTQEIRQSEASKTIGGNIVDSLIYAVVLFMVFGFFGFVVGGFAGKHPLSSAGTAGKFGFLIGIIAGLIQGIIEYNRTIKGK